MNGPMKRFLLTWNLAYFALGFLAATAFAQPLGEPDRGAPGDAMIQEYLRLESEKLSDRFADDLKSREEWESRRGQYLDEYYYMLGLSPLPERTPLEAQIVSTLEQDDYAVDLLHYQSRPGLYVTGNLYRPKQPSREKSPAVFYVCGHSGRGRNGNKVAFQSHGIWFARHGYVCLVVDTLQLGEIAAFHHGTYNLDRWWWHSRGYTPAGVEAWNGVRGIDYLVSRADVDPERIAVTGISGGGAATFWIAAADPRVKIAVPVSGMADLESYVPNRVINGHCDCMFLYNAFGWPWTRIAGLVAPRPMLFVNSDQDGIFPMDANERIAARMESLYSLFGAGDRFDTVVSVGGHAYRQDIREAAYRFIESHARGNARPIEDSEVDVVSEGGSPGAYPIEPEKLRVFPTDADLPADRLNAEIDQSFVPMGTPEAPTKANFAAWKDHLRGELKRVSFGYFPDSIPVAEKVRDVEGNTERLRSERGIEFEVRFPAAEIPRTATAVLIVLNEDDAGTTPAWVKKALTKDQFPVFVETRGIGATRWTGGKSPHYVARSHALLGRTVDTGRVWDVIAAAKYVANHDRWKGKGEAPSVQVAGAGAAGLIAAYAALFEDSISAVKVVAPPAGHMAPESPRFLNVLRVCDAPDVLAMLAPRSLRIVDGNQESFKRTAQGYAAAGASGSLKLD